MITTETPHKLAEILRDTWPQYFNGLDKQPEVSYDAPESYEELCKTSTGSTS